jgi:2',3'-cyclic-nucleotide 2'-phosphodiesterase (5'-nucleotidase family)
VARRATLVKSVRTRHARTLLLDAGNALWSEQALASESKGKVIIDAMNLMRYDAMAIGDLDLLLDVDTLRQRIAEAQFPVLSANVQISGTHELLARPYAVIDVGGERIGIIGLTWDESGSRTDRTPQAYFKILSAQNVLSRYMGELKDQVKIIIFLSTMGLEDDRLLSSTPGIALIVGGRTRGPMAQAWVNAATATRVVQAGSQGEWIGVRRLIFDNMRDLIQHDDQLVYLTEDYADDPEMTALLQTYRLP